MFIINNYYLQGKTNFSESTKTDDDSIKFKEESRLLLMKSSERINLDNGSVFLKNLIQEKIYSNQINECK